MASSTTAQDLPDAKAGAERSLLIRMGMLGRMARVGARRDRSSRAVARALGTNALGLTSRRERDWIHRIEARRNELSYERTTVQPEFPPESTGVTGSWFAAIDGPVPIWGIARMFSIPPSWGTFLLRLIRELSPRSCLELGTGLGLSAAYQAAALELNGSGSLTTMEGAAGWAAVAAQGLDDLGLGERARVEVGAIDDLLPELAARLDPIDYAFLDADHSVQATLEHFEVLLPHLSPGATVLLDDIAQSDEMRRAWMSIGASRRAATSLSLGRMGVVTIR